MPLDEVLLTTQGRGIEVLASDEAVNSLGKIDRRKSRLAELRYFGGLSLEETAEVLSISQETTKPLEDEEISGPGRSLG